MAPINIAGAYNQRPSQQPNVVPRLEIPEGIYNGSFIGIGVPFETFDRFKGCNICGSIIESNPKGPRAKGSGMTSEGACVACEGTGMAKAVQVALKYVLDTEELIQEAVTFKLSAPFKLKNGSTSNPSTMFLRFKTFSGLQDPEEIIAWGKALPEEINVPVTLIIKGDQYPKISDVLKRFVPANGKKPEPKLIPEDEAPF